MPCCTRRERCWPPPGSDSPSRPASARCGTPELSTPPLVSTSWLAARLDDPTVRPLDASWYLPSAARDARREFEAAHIPGAAFFDLDAVSDPASSLPHTMPSPERFEAEARQLGVSRGDFVVVYDGSGANMSAGRAWLMFRAFGHADVAVLDGGFGRWQAEGHPVERGNGAVRRGNFAARRDPGLVVGAADVLAAVSDGSAQVVDARSAGRFSGTAPEPRPGLRGGHIPGSRNVPYTELVRPDGTMRSAAELREIFERAGVDLERPVIATCGSGVTACAVLHALHRVGHHDGRLYDGSWTEWGARPDLPIETG